MSSRVRAIVAALIIFLIVSFGRVAVGFVLERVAQIVEDLNFRFSDSNWSGTLAPNHRDSLLSFSLGFARQSVEMASYGSHATRAT